MLDFNLKLSYKKFQECFLLAGTESGLIITHTWADQALKKINELQAHAGTIQRIQFRQASLEFASCSKDGSARIFKVSLA